MFEFFTTIFTKITTVIAGAIITIGIVSMPIEEPKQSQQLTNEVKILKQEIVKLKNKPPQPKITERIIEKLTVEKNTREPIKPTLENTELKIATCKATKQSSYENTLLKLEQATNERLKKVFDSLNKQYKDTVNKIFATADINISRIKNDPMLSGTSKVSLIKQYNDDASYRAEQLYQNQQIFWKNQRVEIEKTKQESINKLNASLSEDYNKCLNQ